MYATVTTSGIARMLEPIAAPRPMSATPRTALATLIPTSGLAAAIPTKAPPAAAEKPHCWRSLFRGSASRSAPQCAATIAAIRTRTQIQGLTTDAIQARGGAAIADGPGPVRPYEPWSRFARLALPNADAHDGSASPFLPLRG